MITISKFTDELLLPIFQTAGMSEQDSKKLSDEFTKNIAAQIFIKLVDILSVEEKKKLEDQLATINDSQGKLNKIGEFIQNVPDSQKIVNNYFESDFPVIFNDLLDRFIDKATIEQKQKLLSSLHESVTLV